MPLSDEQLRGAYDDGMSTVSPADTWTNQHTASLRAVEAAVRADQIERDAAIAERVVPIVDDPTMEALGRNAGMVIAAAIRAQLNGDSNAE